MRSRKRCSMLSNCRPSRSLLLAAGVALPAGALITCTDASPEPSDASTETAQTESLARPLTFTTVFKAPIGLEGLTADDDGNLYVGGRGGNPTCPVWRLPAAGGAVAVVGTLPAPCSPAGLAFDRHGDLFLTDGADKTYKLHPDAAAPPAATLFSSGTPGANGIAFDREGNLWASDGVTGQGRVFRISS